MKIYQPKDYKGNKLVSDKELAAKNYVTQEQHATKADKEAFEAHKNNEVIHVTQDNKDRWNDTYTTSELDAALDLKADKATVAEELAKKPDITITGEKGTSLLFNETDGGGAVFEGDDFKSGVAVNDGTENIYAQLYAKNTDGTQAKRLNVSLSGIYYTKDKENPGDFDENDEVIVKSDLADFETHIADNVIHVTQQDKDLWNDHVSTTDFNAHKDNKEIHITGTERDTWNKKVTTEQLEATKKSLQDEISEKVASMLHWKGSVATEDLLPKEGNITGDCYNVTATGANWAWTGTEWDKLSEDISGLASKEELRTVNEELTSEIAKKVNTTDYTQKVTELKADIDTRALQTTVDGIETRTQTLETKTTELETNKADKTELGQTNQALDDYKEEAKQAFDSYKEEVTQQFETKVDKTTYDQDKQDLQAEIEEKVKTLQEDIDTRATEADLTLAEGRISDLETTTENLSKTKADQFLLEEAKQEFETYKSEKQEEFEQYQREVETQLGTKVNNDTYNEKVDELQGEIDAKVEQTDYDEKVKSIEDTLKIKADEDSVQSRLDEKVNVEDYNQQVSDLEADLATKETKENVKKVTDKVTSLETFIQQLSDTKANKADVTSEISKLTDSLNTYKEETDAALDTKVNEITYNAKVTELQGKIDTKVDNVTYTAKVSSLEDEIETKADQATVTQELAKKVDTETFNTQIDTKANKTDVENKLKLKADVTDLNNLKGEVTTLEGRVQTLEAIEVDQEYNQDSQNAQSGIAVAQAIVPLATQAALLQHEAKAEATYAVKTEVQKSLDDLTQKTTDLENNKEDKTTVAALTTKVTKIEGEYITENSQFQYTPVVSTAWGNSRNASCNYFQVHARYIRPGKLKSVTIQGKDDTYANSTPYLTLFTSTTGEKWTKLATSTNSTAVTQAEAGTFEFDNLTLPSDLHIRFVFTSTNTDVSPEGDNTLVGVSGMQRASDDLISNVHGAGADAGYLTRFTFNYDATTTESVKNHIGDSSKHFTGSEKQWLISFLQGYDGTTTFKNIVDRLGESATESAIVEIQKELKQKAEQSALTALSQTVSTKADKSALDALTATVNTKASEESVNELKTNLQSELQSTKDDVTQAQTDITELEGRVDSAESSITSLESTKATKDELNKEVETLEASISGVEEKITTHTQDGNIHVTSEQKTEWSNKYTKEETDNLLKAKADQATVNEALELKAEKSEVEKLKTEVGTKASTETVTALQTQVTGIDGEVDQLTSDLESLETQVTGIDETVKTKADQTALTALQTTVSNNKTEIEGKLTAATTQLEEKIKDAVSSMFRWKGDIATKAELEALEEHEIGDVYNVEEDGANYVWSGEEWDKLSENITGLATKEELTTAKDELQGSIDKVSGELTTAKQELEGEISGLSTKVTANETSITSLNSSVSDLSGKLTAAEGEIDTLQSDIETKAESETVTTLQGKVTQLEESVKSLESGTITVDQEFKAESDKPQSGKAIAGELTKYTTIEKLNEKADSSELTALQTKVGSKVDKDTLTEKLQEYVTTTNLTTALEDKAEKTEVETLQSTVTGLESLLSEKASAKDVTDLTAKVDANTKALDEKAAQSALETLQEQVDENTAALADLASSEALTALTAKVDANTEALKTKAEATAVSQLETKVDGKLDTATFNQQIATYTPKAAFDQLAETVEGKAEQKDLETLESTVTANQTEITGKLSTHEQNEEIHFTTGQKKELTDKVDSLETTVAEKANTSDLNSFKSTVSSTYATKSEVTTLTSTVNSKASQTDLENLQTQVEANEAAIENKVDNEDFTVLQTQVTTNTSTLESKADYVTVETLSGKVDKKLDTATFDSTIATYAKTETVNELSSTVEANKTVAETALNNHANNKDLHVTTAEHEKIAKIITCDEATKIAIYTDPSKAPALEDREPGVLYLIGGNTLEQIKISQE